MGWDEGREGKEGGSEWRAVMGGRLSIVIMLVRMTGVKGGCGGIHSKVKFYWFSLSLSCRNFKNEIPFHSGSRNRGRAGGGGGEGIDVGVMLGVNSTQSS